VSGHDVSVFVDEVSTANRQGRPWAHLAADTLDELHEFAFALGLRPTWFHKGASTPHYDVTPAQRSEAIALGAYEVDRRTFAHLCRAWRAIRKART
jgi:hypothetical protein